MAVAIALALPVGFQLPAFASEGSGPQTLTIGVDHVDPANQQPFPPFNRLFEYTDFFSRQVTVHQGDTLNFRAAPGSFHIVALAKSEAVARQVYPVALADEDGGQDTALGSGSAKIVLGPSNFPITGGSVSHPQTAAIDFTRPNGPPVCGGTGEATCTFTGPDDIEVAGPNPGFGPTGLAPADWKIQINAPVGTYAFFCYIHPGMRGTVKVVKAGSGSTTQAQINHRSAEQFKSDRKQALDAEKDANVIRFTGGDPGSRAYQVHVGVSAADNHVAIDEMLPNKPLHLEQGDRVMYLWRDPHNVHSVKFPAAVESDPSPFGFDCGATFSSAGPCLEPGDSHPEFIADPGTSPGGTALSGPADLVDSGVLIGTGYGIVPSVQTWSIRTTEASQTGTYSYHCTVHDWMQGKINLGASDESDQSQRKA